MYSHLIKTLIVVLQILLSIGNLNATIKFDKTIIDLGVIEADKVHTINFIFVNESDQDDYIYDVKTSCRCIKCKWIQKKLWPYQKDSLSITLTPFSEEDSYEDFLFINSETGTQKLSIRYQILTNEDTDKFKYSIGPISFTCKILDCGVSRNNYTEDKQTVIYNSSDIPQYIEFYNCPQNFKYSISRNPIPAKSSSGLYYSMLDSSIKRGDHYYQAQLYANNIPIGNISLKTNVEIPIKHRSKISYIFQPKLKLSQDIIIVSNRDNNVCYHIKLSNPGLTPLKILHIDFDSDIIQLNSLKKRIRPFGQAELVFTIKKTFDNNSTWTSKIKIHSNSIKNDIAQILIVGHK